MPHITMGQVQNNASTCTSKADPFKAAPTPHHALVSPSSAIKCFKNLPCAPGQFCSHFPLTVPTNILFALISTSSTKLHSLSSTPSALSASSKVSVLKHLQVVRCVSPSGALMIHSTPSSKSVICASNLTVVSHRPAGSAFMWSVIL